MGFDREKLIKVAEALETEALFENNASLASKRQLGDFKFRMDIAFSRPSKCETVGCIAGAIIELFGPKDNLEDWVLTDAGQIVGLNENQVNALFDPTTIWWDLVDEEHDGPNLPDYKNDRQFYSVANAALAIRMFADGCKYPWHQLWTTKQLEAKNDQRNV